jgi:phenylacetate-coenzyme A ligase PaaK-like adenylate-forming protein
VSSHSLLYPNYIQDISADSFVGIALSLFQYQYINNPLYHSFVDALHVVPSQVSGINEIPFLPISFFKSHTVASGPSANAPLVFSSSGTTGQITSKHYVLDESLYEDALLQGFKVQYGDLKDYAILALLPSYLERKDASLVHMAKVWMRESAHPVNGFYLNEWKQLADVLQRLEQNDQPAILLGVTFALLDFAEAYPMHLKHTIVMETGGMKGRREEWTRNQVHDYLKNQWQLPQIHSEYGMTELLSQAYAPNDGLFIPSPTMRVLIRDPYDPLELNRSGSGGINIIDLANVHSCAFIATEDIGTLYDNGNFEVLGRLDNADLRGCNLMVL